MPRPSSLPAGNSSHAFWANLIAAWTFHATGNSGAGCDPVKGGSIGTLTTATRNDTTGLTDTTDAGKCQLASTLTLAGPYSMVWRCKLTALNSNAMVFGNGTKYVWMNRGTNSIRIADGISTYEHTVPDAAKTLLYDYCMALSGASGTQTYKLYYKLSTDTTWTSAGSLSAVGTTFDIANFGDGFSSLGFVGELHYFQYLDTELTLANLNASFADPYDILAGNSISLTAQSVTTRVKSKKTSGTYSFTLAGTYSGTGAIAYKWGASGAWTTLVASPTGGTYSQSVTVDGTVAAQGFTVRLASDTSKTASDPLVTIADEIWVCETDSISDGRLTNLQTHTGRTYTSLKYDTTNGWTECDDPVSLGGVNGSYWPILSNLLADDKITCFIALGSSGALMSNFTVGAISSTVTASGIANITGVLMHGGANDVNSNHANTNSASAWSTLCQSLATSIAGTYAGAVIRYAILGDVSSLTGKGARATAVRQGTLAAIAAAPTTCKLGANIWWRELATDHLHPVSDAEGLDYGREWWQVGRTGSASAPAFLAATHNAAKTVVTVRFDQSLRTGTTLTPACFQVYDDGVAKTISTAAVTNGDRVALTLSSACTGTITVSMGEGLSSFGTPPQGTSVSLPNSGGSFYPAAIPFFLQSVSAVDETAPTLTSATINTAGTICTLSFTEAGSAPILPVGGITGFSLTASGGAVSIAATSRTASTTVVLALSRVILSGETVTVNYSSGNVTDSAETPNSLATITNQAVTNNSTATAGGSGGIVLARSFSSIGSW